MKTSRHALTIVAAVLLVLTFTSCKKGDTGPKGDTGAQGPAGNNGVANISTFIVTTTNTSWIFNSAYNEYDATINVSGISSSVVTNGMVMVFLGNTAQTQWAALPFSYQNVEFSYTYLLGQVLLTVTLGNGNAPANPGGIPFKIVVVPPAMIKPDVNHNNYAEVKAAYNLKD